MASLNSNSKQTKVLIGTPAYGGMCCTAYTEALLYTTMYLSQKNINFNVKFINNQIVTRARNMICSIFMDDESYTHLLFIDADIKWSPEHVIMLLEHDLECVIGVYPNKQYYKIKDDIKLNPSSQFASPQIENNNLVKINKAATGFMLLKKSALIKIQKDVETFILPNSEGKDIELYNYFDCMVVDKNYLTEDYYFSHLFNKNGGEIWADKRIVLGHIGSHTYGELI
tara:strand:- start:727 stop:1407 length:681 start_codon:yes stop_codon:yes gene_type:complete